ncbi:NAD(P)-binding domain-containing protein, partial [Nostocoides sp.]|uniref:NAD(P)-binding domain-containing protein n=1 Tax=Nostocoides sp. TaxID=1917966 RepID=UPI003BAEBB94
MPPLPPGRLRVGVIGAGKVGAVLGAALANAGHLVVAASAVSEASLARAAVLLPDVPIKAIDEVIADSDLVVLAVPDDALATLVHGL